MAERGRLCLLVRDAARELAMLVVERPHRPATLIAHLRALDHLLDAYERLGCGGE